MARLARRLATASSSAPVCIWVMAIASPWPIPRSCCNSARSPCCRSICRGAVEVALVSQHVTDASVGMRLALDVAKPEEQRQRGLAAARGVLQPALLSTQPARGEQQDALPAQIPNSAAELQALLIERSRLLVTPEIPERDADAVQCSRPANVVVAPCEHRQAVVEALHRPVDVALLAQGQAQVVVGGRLQQLVAELAEPWQDFPKACDRLVVPSRSPGRTRPGATALPAPARCRQGHGRAPGCVEMADRFRPVVAHQERAARSNNTRASACRSRPAVPRPARSPWFVGCHPSVHAR